MTTASLANRIAPDLKPIPYLRRAGGHSHCHSTRSAIVAVDSCVRTCPRSRARAPWLRNHSSAWSELVTAASQVHRPSL
eukprot:scaffold4163_cov425-Prasinococcus_capsulatus_cf.AAC.9